MFQRVSFFFCSFVVVVRNLIKTKIASFSFFIFLLARSNFIYYFGGDLMQVETFHVAQIIFFVSFSMEEFF